MVHIRQRISTANTVKIGDPCFGEYRIDGDTDAYPISQKLHRMPVWNSNYDFRNCHIKKK